MARKFIAKTEHLAAILQDPDPQSDFMVITFNELGTIINGDRFWGDSLLEKEHISSIGIVTSEPNWYPPAEMEEIMAAVEQFTNGRRVVTYGHSQGGYGAIKYSARLNSEVAVAFCPQWSINPADVGGFDDRFISYYKQNLKGGEKIKIEDVCGKVYVFFDRREPSDFENIKRIKQEGIELIDINVPFSLHDTVRLVAESGRSSDFLRAILSNKHSKCYFRNFMRETRKRSITYKKHQEHSLLKRFVRRKASSRSSLFLCRHSSSVGLGGALVSFVSNRSEEALCILNGDASNSFQGTSPIDWWNMFRQVNFMEGELKVAEIIIKQHFEKTFLVLHAINSFIKFGEVAIARNFLSILAAREETKKHIDHFINFSAQTNNLEAIEKLLNSDDIELNQSQLLKIQDLFHKSGKVCHSIIVKNS